MGLDINNVNAGIPIRTFMLGLRDNSNRVLFPQTTQVNNNKNYEQDFNAFAEQAYAGIPDVTTTVEEKQRAILAKISILNHPQCPPETKAALTEEITQINYEIQNFDDTKSGYDDDFDTFVQKAYAGIPDSTTNINDKQKAILAKVAIINHPNCPEDTKLELAKELKILNDEIMGIKANCNRKA